MNVVDLRSHPAVKRIVSLLQETGFSKKELDDVVLVVMTDPGPVILSKNDRYPVIVCATADQATAASVALEVYREGLK